MSCSANRCGTGVPPGRPFCTRHIKILPYRITKDFWLAGAAREQAILDAIAYLREVEAGAPALEATYRPRYQF